MLDLIYLTNMLPRVLEFGICGCVGVRLMREKLNVAGCGGDLDDSGRREVVCCDNCIDPEPAAGKSCRAVFPFRNTLVGIMNE